jgi:hypothetical protein
MRGVATYAVGKPWKLVGSRLGSGMEGSSAAVFLCLAAAKCIMLLAVSFKLNLGRSL